ncbi:MAG: RdgB/HAM1 family non-canonical purine NTP pyrophosphatase [Paramuribaculum intestinale]
MRRRIVFATNNAHKLDEIRAIAGDRPEVLSLADKRCHDDIPENEPTIEGNAIAKARWVRDRYGYDCFADDTGLMVDALGGEPGVRSARYAGPRHDSEANVALLLERMDGVADRRAHFTTVIALTEGDETRVFEGRVDGEILTVREGEDGFGYDPVFRPEGCAVSFASMSADEKNAISHRGRATARLLEYFNSL